MSSKTKGSERKPLDLTFADACHGLSFRQALKNADALLTLRFWSSSKRPSCSRVVVLGRRESASSFSDGGDEVASATLLGAEEAVALAIADGAKRWRCSRFFQSKQFRAFRKHDLVFREARKQGTRGGGAKSGLS